MMSSPAVCQVLRTNLSPKVACGLRNRRAPKVQACVPRAPGATSFQRNAQCRVGLLMRKSQVLVGYQHNVRLITSSFPRPSYSGARKSTVVAVSAEKTVLVPIANGCDVIPAHLDTKCRLMPFAAEESEEMEAAIMVDVLRRAGAIVTVASVEPDLVCTMSRNMKFVADCLITECENITYDLVALPGGMPGAERLRDSVPLMNIIKKQAAAKQPYAAMCAAPAVVLQPNGLLTGVAATAHPAFVDKLEGDSKDGRVVIDDNIITSRGPGTAFEFALAMVEFLFDSQKAKDVAGPMVLPPAVKASLVAKEWPGL